MVHDETLLRHSELIEVKETQFYPILFGISCMISGAELFLDTVKHCSVYLNSTQLEFNKNDSRWLKNIQTQK